MESLNRLSNYIGRDQHFDDNSLNHHRQLDDTDDNQEDKPNLFHLGTNNTTNYRTTSDQSNHHLHHLHHLPITTAPKPAVPLLNIELSPTIATAIKARQNKTMNSPHHHHHHEHHDVHQQRLLWFFSFCNQRSSSSSSSSGGSSNRRGSGSNRRKSNSNRNKFATQYQYQQQLQQQQRQSSNVFGRDLTEHTQSFSDEDSIPYIVKSCTRFIEKHGIIFGIYRLTGMRVNIHKLRQDFDNNPKISMIDGETISNDAHAVACVLKQYFRELPTPLLTFHMYEKFIELFKHNKINTNNNNDDKSNNNNNIHGDDDDIISNDAIDQNKSLNHDNNNTSCASENIQSSAAIATQTQKKQFTTSASDSQLLSLSSVVTTTSSDVKYQVKLGDLKQLLMQLPQAHYHTLKFLMRHLACIAANGKKTGMDSKNVAIVWAPNLLKPRELELSAGLETLQIIGLQAVITEQLIKHHKFLFGEEDDLSTTGASNIQRDQNSNLQQQPQQKESPILPSSSSLSSPLLHDEPMHKNDDDEHQLEEEVDGSRDKSRDENEENKF